MVGWPGCVGKGRRGGLFGGCVGVGGLQLRCGMKPRAGVTVQNSGEYGLNGELSVPRHTVAGVDEVNAVRNEGGGAVMVPGEPIKLFLEAVWQRL